MNLFLGQGNVEVVEINPRLHRLHLIVHLNHPPIDVQLKKPYVLEDIQNRHKAACDYLYKEGFLGVDHPAGVEQWETFTGVVCGELNKK